MEIRFKEGEIMNLFEIILTLAIIFGGDENEVKKSYAGGN